MDGRNIENQVQIIFKTRQKQYALPDTPYTVNASVTPIDLNVFVNALLEKSSNDDIHVSVEFDFLILDEYLRCQLNDHLKEKGISIEDNIEIEYVERFQPPEPQDCLLHDDWVSAVQMCNNWILTGCYDNTVNLWNNKGEHLLTMPGHSMPVKTVAWLDLDEKTGKFISGSQDQTAIMWNWSIETNSVKCISICKGHERAIESIGVSPDKQRFATGSWDTMLKIWSADSNGIVDDSRSQTKKRVKTDQTTVKTPLMTLEGHRENISSVQWMDSTTLITGSWDHTIKIWDLNLEGVQSEITTNKSIFDSSYSKLNRMILTASADSTIRLYDSRTNQTSVMRNSFLGHQQWIQAVMWSTNDEYLFVSGAYDCQSKLWDCRCPKGPLYDLIGHNDKVQDIDWSNPKYIISGGADNTVRVFRSNKVLDNRNTTNAKG